MSWWWYSTIIWTIVITLSLRCSRLRGSIVSDDKDDDLATCSEKDCQTLNYVGILVDPLQPVDTWNPLVSAIRASNPTSHMVLCLLRKGRMMADQRFYKHVLQQNLTIDIDTEYPCAYKQVQLKHANYVYLNAAKVYQHHITDYMADELFHSEDMFTILASKWNTANYCFNQHDDFHHHSSTEKSQLYKCLNELNALSSTAWITVPKATTSSSVNSYSAEQYTPEKAIPAFHRSNFCQLWWPLNNSEIFIHSYVPKHLSPLRIKQKFIVFCNYSISSLTRNAQRYETNVEITDITRQSGRISDSISTIRSVSLPSISQPQVFESLLEVHALDNEVLYQKELKLELEHPLLGKCAISLELNLVYGVEYESAGSSAVAMLHSMASQLDSRDDLGFALSALLPNASTFVEVGVQVGNYAELIVNTWGNLTTYIAVDPWKEWPKDEYFDIANNEVEKQESIYQSVLQRLYPYGEQVLVIREESSLAAKMFEDETLDVVYLDAMHHYEAVKNDIESWWKKVKPCGLLAGHDYLLDVLHGTIFTVKPAVQEFARRNKLLVLQTYDEERPSYPTWFLYKPCHAKM